MRKLILLIALLCSCPAWATWTCAQGGTLTGTSIAVIVEYTY
jgi:hypothetical protein